LVILKCSDSNGLNFKIFKINKCSNFKKLVLKYINLKIFIFENVHTRKKKSDFKNALHCGGAAGIVI
jgi:hypothetical protein